MRLRIDGPFVTETVVSLKYLCEETMREQVCVFFFDDTNDGLRAKSDRFCNTNDGSCTKNDSLCTANDDQVELKEQEKMALRTSKESAQVWLAALVEWGEMGEKHKEQTDEDYAIMAAEASLIERKKQYAEFVKSLQGKGVVLPEWKMGENSLDSACVFERRVVVAREKVKDKVDWRAKQNASDENPDGAAPVASTAQEAQESGEGWKEKQARLAEQRKKKQEEEAKVKEAEIDDIDIGGTSSDEEAEAAASEPAGFMKEFAKGKVDKGESLLTRDEFRVYDADDSGEVEFEEFKALVRDKGWIYELSDGELQLAWQRIDADGGGSISYEELQEWWGKGPGDRFKDLQANPREKEQLEWATKKFREHDADGNEALDPSEFKGLHMELVERGLVSISLDASLAELDRDGDGEISISEFIVWLLDSVQKDDKKAAGVIASGNKGKGAGQQATAPPAPADELTKLAALAALDGQAPDEATTLAGLGAVAVDPTVDEAAALAALGAVVVDEGSAEEAAALAALAALG